MTYQTHGDGYVFWNDTLLLPMKKKQPGEKTKYFRKTVAFEDAPNYWEYTCEDGCWNVYYVKRGVDRRLAQYNIGEFSPESIIARISDKDISVTDCNHIGECMRGKERTPLAGVFWSIEYDGKSVFELMQEKTKMPFGHIKMVIENEGGFISADGIIHRGTCRG